MPSQIIGYYNSRQQKLLKDFDRTSALMKDSLVERYGKEFAGTLEKKFLLDENGALIGQVTGHFRFVLASPNKR
ncbi:MAG: hypothetical protein QNJ54_34395 [Prochloraceae cyanobacterium]|nr:hypothetical protein [Prochloraceae cyanobacterium]